MTDATTTTTTSAQTTAPWYGELPADTAPEFKSWLGNKNFADPQTALMSAWNQEKLLGADRAGRTVVLPKDDSDTEGLKAFRAKIGVPDKADAYNLPVPEGLPKEFAATAAGWFHKHGVPPAAARAISADWNAHLTQVVEAQQAEALAKSTEELNAVKAEWSDKFDANAEIARRYMKATGLNEEQVAAIEGALGTGVFLKTFHKLGMSLGEAKFATGDPGGFNANKAEAERKFAELRQQRAEGKITDAMWEQQSEVLRRQIAMAA